MRWLWLSALIVVLDQWSKALATKHLVLYEPVAVLPSLNLTLMHNTGAAFSVLGGASGWQRWLFVALALGVSAGIVLWLRRAGEEGGCLPGALALVLGGAVGNLVDRLGRGYVVDFLDLYYGAWHWPAFNVADCAISVGALMLLVDALRSGTAKRRTIDTPRPES